MVILDKTFLFEIISNTFVLRILDYDKIHSDKRKILTIKNYLIVICKKKNNLAMKCQKFRRFYIFCIFMHYI